MLGVALELILVVALFVSVGLLLDGKTERHKIGVWIFGLLVLLMLHAKCTHESHLPHDADPYYYEDRYGYVAPGRPQARIPREIAGIYGGSPISNTSSGTEHSSTTRSLPVFPMNKRQLRQPHSVEYDCRGVRKVKQLPDAWAARRFYAAKLKAGANPRFVRPA